MTVDRDAALDLVAAYAVDAIEPEEAARVEAMMATDISLQHALDHHHAVLAELAVAVDPNPSTPSPLLWANVAARIAGADEVSPRLASVRDLRAQKRFSRATAALAVAAIGLAALLSVSVVRLQQERTTPPIEAAIQELLEDPGSTVATLTGAGDATTQARIVLGAEGVGYVYSDTLPLLDTSRTYQLWAIIDDRVISAGVLGNNPEDSPFQIVGEVAGFAITEEVAGGVAVSEGETVAVWLRDA